MTYHRGMGLIRTNLNLPGQLRVQAPTALITSNLTLSKPRERVAQQQTTSTSKEAANIAAQSSTRRAQEEAEKARAAAIDRSQASFDDTVEEPRNGLPEGYAPPDGSGTPMFFDMTTQVAPEQKIPWWLIIAGVAAVGGVGYYIWKK